MSLTDFEDALIITATFKEFAARIDQRFPEHDERAVRLIRAFETAADLIFDAEEVPSVEKVRALGQVLYEGAKSIIEQIEASRAAGRDIDRE